MSKLIKDKVFRKGVFSGFAIFLAVQIISYLVYLISSIINFQSGISIHVFWDIGFPFSMYYGMFSIFQGSFAFVAFLGNMIVGIIFSFINGLIFKFVWSNISARKLQCRSEPSAANGRFKFSILVF